MTFNSNVTFQPHCSNCKGPGAQPHSVYGLICPACHAAGRLDALIAEVRQDSHCMCDEPAMFYSRTYGGICVECLDDLYGIRSL